MKKIFFNFSILILLFLVTGCGAGSKKDKSPAGSPRSHDDSIMAMVEDGKKRVEPFQNFREDFIVPASMGSPDLTRGKEIPDNEIPAKYSKTVDAIDAWKDVISNAGRDSTTELGPMMRRYKILTGSQKRLSADYDRTGHLVRFSNSGDFYFKNSKLVFYEHKVSEHTGKNVHLTQDDFYLDDGKVIYAYRDEGTGAASSSLINFVDVLRYQLNGDKDAHIAKAFTDFQDEYKILLGEKLEPTYYIK